MGVEVFEGWREGRDLCVGKEFDFLVVMGERVLGVVRKEL